MGKRRFRFVQKKSQPSYPTLEAFDGGRRQFLQQIGGALLGAGALAAGLSACGDRSVGGDPDMTQPPQGVAPVPDARVDTGADTRPLEPDGQPLAGVPRAPDAQVDARRPAPDAEMPTPGVAPLPPAQKDLGPVEPDGLMWAGDRPGPPSKLDGGSCPVP